MARQESELERAISRCGHLERLILHSFPPSKLPVPLKQTLLRHLRAELRSLPSPSPNLPHLEALLHVLLLPSVAAPSRLLLRSPTTVPHVDLVCTFRSRPAWVLVSARNPRHLRWLPDPHGIRDRVSRVVTTARAAAEGATSRPEIVVVFFCRGLRQADGSVAKGLVGEFGAVEVEEEWVGFGDVGEDGWVDVSYRDARTFEIAVREEEKGMCLRGIGSGEMEGSREEEENERVGLGEAFCAAVEGLEKDEDAPVGALNFDTTALVAMVSGISNGRGKEMVDAPEEKMRERFKGNYTFVMDQVHSELQSPIFADLKLAIAGKKGIVCTTSYEEFVELLSMYGGPNEQKRAARLLKFLARVPDSPSARISDLPTTRKIARKNKIIFGTGDYWRAPTLTANMGFVRAITQTGMSLLTIEHKPRALTGD